MRPEFKGENHHCAKLTEAQAREIVSSEPWTIQFARLKSKEFGVSKHTIYNIRYKKAWTHLHES
jgi:hypothetical protein